MAYCTNCGKQVNENQNFCGSCGARLNNAAPASPTPAPVAAVPVQQPVQAATPPVAQGETIRCIIPNLMVPKSFGRSDTYNLIVTERRSIFAKLTQQIMNETIKARRDKAAGEGKGFFGKWAAQMKGFNTYGDHYVNMTAEQALNETAGNYAIENSSIGQIKVRDESDDESPSVTYGVEFSTAGRSLKFKVNMYNPADDIKKAYPGVVVK